MQFVTIYAIVITVILIGTVVAFLLSSDRKKEEKKEIEKKKLEIMVSQIKPHFIYNVLNSIYYLCDQDTAKAQEAISEFSDYLRANLDSINEESTVVPFSQEMKHIENYMRLEKLRFGDELEIKYDIKTQDFYVPALSIQPLMENAVKHGIRGSEDGGTVTLSTEDTGKEIVITVSDTGVGYDPHYKDKKADGKSHVGLSNVRERLAMTCGGILDIYSTDGKGTRVVVRIPKGGK